MHLSQPVLEHADARRLGDPIRSFDSRVARRRARAWLALLVLAGAGLVPAALMYLSAGRWALGVPAAALAVAYLGGGAWIAANGAPFARARAVHLFTGGLVVADGGGVHGYGWDDLVSVTVTGVLRHAGGRTGLRTRGRAERAEGRTRWRFTVVAVGGRTLRFGDELPGVRSLGETVAAEVTRRMVPRCLALLAAGDAVRFGPFTADRDGIEKEDERVAWTDLREASVENGLVVVRSWGGGPVLAATAGQTPDAFALVELARQIRRLIALANAEAAQAPAQPVNGASGRSGAGRGAGRVPQHGVRHA
ncbi:MULTISPECIES: DUF6585 family protein [Actinomadura]|uniref:DUF6585 family protein n=1 Tax=Actinomadura yumaensis TaxID=111807 RepID=A0ABW2CG44_9ACTN|nr:DUF6585 family protein [Actinomadura sp. J1-007]MWK34415.1 hypothetical protein [Actinomadura sp. J1-007]